MRANGESRAEEGRHRFPPRLERSEGQPRLEISGGLRARRTGRTEEKLRWGLVFTSPGPPAPPLQAAAHNNRKPPRLDFARRRQIQRRPLKSNEVVIVVVLRRIYWLRPLARPLVAHLPFFIAPGIHSRSGNRRTDAVLEIEMDAKLSCLVGGRGARCGFSCILKDAGELESGGSVSHVLERGDWRILTLTAESSG